jgi:hypothetical protein
MGAFRGIEQLEWSDAGDNARSFRDCCKVNIKKTKQKKTGKKRASIRAGRIRYDSEFPRRDEYDTTDDLNTRDE